MWIIHHSLNQSIEFHLVRCYTGHVIDSLVPCHWSLNDTQCWFVDAHARTDTCTHTYIACLYPASPGLRCQGENWVPALPKKTPLRLTQGRHVQLAVPTSVQHGLKTGMREACRCCLTLYQQPKVHPYKIWFSFLLFEKDKKNFISIHHWQVRWKPQPRNDKWDLG